MKVVLHAAVFAALAAFVCSSSHAQDVRAACKADREKFCAGMTPAEGKFRECMESHAAELSAECKAARDAAREAWKTVEASCKADAGKFCAGAGSDRRALSKCLESHASELEPACAAAWKSRPGANRA